MKPITLKEVVAAVNGKCDYSDDQLGLIKIKGVSTDSRKVEAGELFIPIIGEIFNGHDYISKAFDQGASASLIQEEVQDSFQGIAIYVKDTKKAIGDLAAYYLSLYTLPVIGITGSVGKTSTKDLVASILKQKYTVHCTQGNFNNDIGLPLTILGLEEDHEVMILEMGMNHFGEIHYLSSIAKPNIAVITNIGVSHIENLGSRQGILQAKSEIFDYIRKNGVGIINGDEPLLQDLKEQLKIQTLTFGMNHNNEYYVSDIAQTKDNGITARVHTPEDSFSIKIHSIGIHMALNSLPGIIIGKKLGLSNKAIQRGLESFVSGQRRLQIHKTSHNRIQIIDDVYNSSPDSVRAGITSFMGMKVIGRRVVILGDMFEMGNYSETAHREIGKFAAEQKVDLVICVGKFAKFIFNELIQKKNKAYTLYYYEKQEELLDQLSNMIKEEDSIYIKASRGMHLEYTIERIKELN